MKNLEIKIPEIGNAVGTLGWVANELEYINNNLVCTHTKDNEPAIFYKSKKDSSKLMYLMCISNSWEPNQTGWEYGRVSIINLIYNHYEEGLFPVLNPSAAKKVEEYLMALADDFEEKWMEK